jgi:hypothetical protein
MTINNKSYAKWAATEKGKEARSRAAAHYRKKHKRDIVARRSHLKQRYGLTVDDWNAMLIEQSGRCDCCGEPMIGKGPCVDHNHETGQIRGLVCQDCNIAVSWVEGRARRLALAEIYLARYNQHCVDINHHSASVPVAPIHFDGDETLPQHVAWLGKSK